MTVPVLESFTTQTAGNVTTIDIAEPSGLATDDLCVVIAVDGRSDSPYTSASMSDDGFTFQNSADPAGNGSAAVFTRIIDVTEVWPITLTLQTSSRYSTIAWALRISGVDTTNFWDALGADVSVDPEQTSIAITGFTSTVADVLAFYLMGADGGDTLPMSVSGTGWSETDEETHNTGGQHNAGSFGTKDLGAAGASGTATVTYTTSEQSWGFQFGIAPVSAGGPSALQMQAYQGMERMSGGFRR